VRIVACVATFGVNGIHRIRNFMYWFNATKYNNLKIIVLNTHNEFQELTNLVFEYNRQYGNVFELQNLGIQNSVTPAHQLLLRVNAVENLCDDDTIYFNLDDDYICNPYWAKFADHIFSNFEQVNYMSLMKMFLGCGMTDAEHISEIIKLDKFNVAITKSALGGSFGTRWKVFYPQAKDFMDKYGLNGQFDVDFWHYLGDVYGTRYNIYMPMDVSLFQHTNMTSQYGHYWPHAYSQGFDPVCDPFEIII
jgi:hypothetical protein